MKWRFEPSDFESALERGKTINADILAGIANAKLAEWLKDATVVYGWVDGKLIKSFSDAGAGITTETHRALLINIQGLPKDPCKHEVKWFTVERGVVSILKNPTCIHCKKRLKVTLSSEEEK